MISRADAIQISTQHFPAGPEHLAAHLKVAVCKSPLKGVEGWCVRGNNTVIRVNASSSQFRQRFTLAHELAHLVLGTQPDIATEPFRSNSKEERDADQLASELLIPRQQLHRHIKRQLPIDAKTLERLAKAANVSPVMAACRVVSATQELGLYNAAVVFFVDGSEKWRFSNALSFEKHEAETLFGQALTNKSMPVRERNSDGNIIVGSLIDAQSYQVLLIQLLPPETAHQETLGERLHRLATRVFGNDSSFRSSVAGSLGAIKKKCEGQSLDEAVQFFEDNYLGRRYTGHREHKLRTDEGREFVRLSLKHWFS